MTEKVTIRGKDNFNGTYLVSHNGLKVTIKQASKPKNMRPERWRIFKNKDLKSSNVRQIILRDKLGLSLAVDGSLFVPREFERATRRKTFRGMSFAEIRKAQRKY